MTPRSRRADGRCATGELAHVGTPDLQRDDRLRASTLDRSRRTARGRRRRPRDGGRSPSSRRPRRGSRGSRRSPRRRCSPGRRRCRKPSPSPLARKLTARFMPPLLATIDAGPGSSRVTYGTKLAITPSAGFMNPDVFGPSSRTPWRASDRPRPRPAGCRPPAVSANPPAHTTAARTPATPQSSSAAGTASAGTTSTARSTGSPIARTERRNGPTLDLGCRWVDEMQVTGKPEQRPHHRVAGLARRTRSRRRPRSTSGRTATRRPVSHLLAPTTSAGCRDDDRGDARARSGRAAADGRGRLDSRATPSGCGCRCRSRCRTR